MQRDCEASVPCHTLCVPQLRYVCCASSDEASSVRVRLEKETNNVYWGNTIQVYHGALCSGSLKIALAALP